jgi:glycosyltransferase involved in cell wall biosynthesis
MDGRPLLLVEALATRNDSGLGRLARLLCDALPPLLTSLDIEVLLPRGGAYRPDPRLRLREVSAWPFRFWCRTAFPLLIARLRPAAVLCLGQTLPPWRPKAKYALVVPDAGPLEALGHATSSHDDYNRRWLATMPRQADRILTIGSFSKSRIAALAGIPAERIDIVKPIGPAAGTGAASTGMGPGPRSPNLPPPGAYLLAMGNVEPRKNFPGLIDAYARLVRRRPDAPPLHIVGHKAWGHAAAAESVRRNGLADRVVFADFVAEPERLGYLAGCRAFVSSSLYEGWGLPLFEALAMGRPSVYHGGTSQDEFARGVALEADCADPEALSRALERILFDEGLRRSLAEALARDFPGVLAYDPAAALRASLEALLGTRLSPP